MTAGGLSQIEKVLALIPVVQANQGIRVEELSRQTGISVEEIVTDLPRLVNLCGVPPYSPVDLVDLEIDGDRVRIHFAEQFRRPVRLTLPEALALDMVLAGWEEEGEGPFARAVESIRRKVRFALSPEVAESVERLDDRISSVSGPGRAAGTVALIKQAMGLLVRVRIEYFSRRRGRLSERTIRPYGIYEHHGHWYVVAHDEEHDEVRTFRADRFRDAELVDGEYEIPEDFEVGRYRREGPPEPESPGIVATIRFEPDAARYARESFPAHEFVEREGGAVAAVVRASGTAWLVSELLRWGPSAVVEEPVELRRELVSAAKRALEAYGR